MRFSKAYIKTLKETPKEAEIASHKLMLRAGMIKKLASGIYAYLPLGYRTIKKIENIVREEMDRAGALELLMPVVQGGFMADDVDTGGLPRLILKTFLKASPLIYTERQG